MLLNILMSNVMCFHLTLDQQRDHCVTYVVSNIIEHGHAQILVSPPMPSVMWETAHRPLNRVGETIRLVIVYSIYGVQLDFIAT